VEPLTASQPNKGGESAKPLPLIAEAGPREPRSSRWRLFLLLTAGWIALFSKVLASLAVYAAGSELQSHILLIPFISAYLIYVRRKRLPNDYESCIGWASFTVLFGLTALGVGLAGGAAQRLSHNDYLALMVVSLLCFVLTGAFLCLGRKWVAAAAFPLAFLIFMVPIPDALANAFETASMLASTEAANALFTLSGTPNLREGTVFQLPNITIQVAQECSGIRSSWVLVITSLLAGDLFLKSAWRRMALVCFVLPLGIVRNGFRVWVIGVLCVQFGPQMIHSSIHHRGGPLFFTLSLIPLFLLLAWLRRQEATNTNSSVIPAGPLTQ